MHRREYGICTEEDERILRPQNQIHLPTMDEPIYEYLGFD